MTDCRFRSRRVNGLRIVSRMMLNGGVQIVDWSTTSCHLCAISFLSARHSGFNIIRTWSLVGAQWVYEILIIRTYSEGIIPPLYRNIFPNNFTYYKINLLLYYVLITACQLSYGIILHKMQLKYKFTCGKINIMGITKSFLTKNTLPSLYFIFNISLTHLI